MPISVPLDQFFFLSWTESMAYVLGFFAADGSMYRSIRGAYYIEFKSTDQELLRQIRQICGSGHHKSVDKPRDRTRPCYRLQIGSKYWFETLQALGFTEKKSHTLAFPSVPAKYLPDFVRGYFDGDGCIYLARTHKSIDAVMWTLQTSFTSGSLTFLNRLQKTLQKAGIVTGGSLVKKERGYELKFSRHDSLALCYFMYNTSQDPPIFLARKRRKYERALEVLRPQTSLRS